MVKIYADLCEVGKRTCVNAEGIVQVPIMWLDATITELRDRGRNDLIPEKVPEA